MNGNREVQLSLFHYSDEAGRLLASLGPDETMLICASREPLAAVYRAESPDDAKRKAAWLAYQGAGVNLRDFEPVDFRELMFDPVGRIPDMVRNWPTKGMLLTNTPGASQYIVVHTLMLDAGRLLLLTAKA